MNERIRELIQEAERKCSETRGVYDEILAELIVRECLIQIGCEYGSGREIPLEGGGHYHSEDWDDALTRVYTNIKEHFGVEE